MPQGPQNGRSQQVGFLFVSFTILQVIKSVNPSVHAEFGEGKHSQVHEFQGSVSTQYVKTYKGTFSNEKVKPALHFLFTKVMI